MPLTCNYFAMVFIPIVIGAKSRGHCGSMRHWKWCDRLLCLLLGLQPWHVVPYHITPHAAAPTTSLLHAITYTATSRLPATFSFVRHPFAFGHLSLGFVPVFTLFCRPAHSRTSLSFVRLFGALSRFFSSFVRPARSRAAFSSGGDGTSHSGPPSRSPPHCRHSDAWGLQESTWPGGFCSRSEPGGFRGGPYLRALSGRGFGGWLSARGGREVLLSC
jgi:hypothetical protein